MAFQFRIDQAHLHHFDLSVIFYGRFLTQLCFFYLFRPPINLTSDIYMMLQTSRDLHIEVIPLYVTLPNNVHKDEFLSDNSFS